MRGPEKTELEKQIATAISDPGAFVRRRTEHPDDLAVRRPEALASWGARAVLQVLEAAAPTREALTAAVSRLVACTCDGHYSMGQSAACRAWRDRTVAQVVDVVFELQAGRTS